MQFARLSMMLVDFSWVILHVEFNRATLGKGYYQVVLPDTMFVDFF
jgi:hypothetical protein